MGFSRILRGGNSGFTRILRSPGAGFSRILRDPVGFSRILRDQSFSRILRSDPDYNNELDEEKRSPSSFTRILRGGGPGDLNSFSRILRGSFSRILKRDAGNSGFTRILRSPGAGFSRYFFLSNKDFTKNYFELRNTNWQGGRKLILDGEAQ